MQFNSFEFINIFLPICLLAIGLFPRFAGYILFIFSSIFYAWNSTVGFILLIFSAIIVHFVRSQLKTNYLGKYITTLFLLFPFIFFRSSSILINLVPVLSDINKIYPESLILPAGVSFYTFQLIGYLFDDKPEATTIKLKESLLYTLFFPQLIAGPIERAEDLIPQIKNVFLKGVYFDPSNIKNGLYLLSFGLFLKTFLGDVLASAFEVDFHLGGSYAAITLMVSNGMVIYFDFLGYTLIAIGLARLFNINLTLNFNRPYASICVGEFWRRWHITLTRWFKTYIYKPIASNYNYSNLSIINATLLVFLLTALWHGFGIRFLIWGVGHYLLVLISRKITPHLSNPIQKYISWFICFLAINFLWLFFFYDLPKCIDIIQSLFNLTPIDSIEFKKRVIFFAPIALIFSLLLEPGILMRNYQLNSNDDNKLVVFSSASKKFTTFLFNITYNYIFIIIFLLSSIAFFSYSQTFIYFRF